MQRPDHEAVSERQLSRDGRDRSKLTPKGCQSTIGIGRTSEAALETTSMCGNVQPTSGNVPMRTPALTVQHDGAVPKRQLSRDGRDRSKLTPKGCKRPTLTGSASEAALETASMRGNVQPTGGNVPMRTSESHLRDGGSRSDRSLKGSHSTTDTGPAGKA